MKELLFVYDAHSSLFPHILNNDEWLAFCERLPMDVHILSSEEVERRFSGIRVDSPTILLKGGDITELVMREQLDDVKSIYDLIELVRSKGF